METTAFEQLYDAYKTPIIRYVSHRVAFGTLSPAAQVLWLLYYHEGLKSSEIAAVLEIPEGTVKTRLSRTRESLRRAYRAQEMGGPLRQHRKTAGKSAASTSEKELEAWFTSML